MRPDPTDRAPIPRPVEWTARRLVLAGWSQADAETMAAYTAGLLPVGSGWTLRELHALEFLRAQRERWPG